MDISSKIFRKKTDDYFISLDIGSEIVKALVVEIDKTNEKAFILGAGERRQKDDNTLIASKDNFRNIISVCIGAIDDAVEIAGTRPKKVIIGMNGSFVKGVSTKINYKRQTYKDRIDENELKKIIFMIRESLGENVREIVQVKENFGFEIDITYSSVTNINIDGYRVMSPVGFKGSDVQFTIFSSFLRKSHHQLMKNISAELNLELLEVISEPYAVSIAKGTKDVSKSNIILVDIGGNVTSVAVIHNGLLEHIETFDLGGKSFTRSLSNELNLKDLETENIKKRFNKDSVDKALADKIEEFFIDNYKVLLDGIELSLEEYTQIDLFPATVLFYGGGSQILRNNKEAIINLIKKRSTFLSQMNVNFVNTSDLTEIIDKTNKLKNLQYINSMSLANFILDKAIEENQCDKILNSAIIK